MNDILQLSEVITMAHAYKLYIAWLLTFVLDFFGADHWQAFNSFDDSEWRIGIS